MVELHPNWRYIVRRAWSFRAAAAASLCSGLAAGLTVAQPYLGLSPFAVSWAIFATTIGATWFGFAAMAARLVKQKDYNDAGHA